MSTIGKVCPKCCVELRPETNGVLAVSMASSGPYEMYQVDLWRCPTCKHGVLLGFSAHPVAQHFSDDIPLLMADAKRRGVPVFRFWGDERERDSYVGDKVADEIEQAESLQRKE